MGSSFRSAINASVRARASCSAPINLIVLRMESTQPLFPEVNKVAVTSYGMRMRVRDQLLLARASSIWMPKGGIVTLR